MPNLFQGRTVWTHINGDQYGEPIHISMFVYGRINTMQSLVVLKNLLNRRRDQLECRIPVWDEQQNLLSRGVKMRQLQAHLIADGIGYQILKDELSKWEVSNFRWNLYQQRPVSSLIRFSDGPDRKQTVIILRCPAF